MSELISGKEAKLAWANGKKLQIANMIVGEDFYDMDDSNTTLNIFDYCLHLNGGSWEIVD